jgi:hypothetical protein
MSTRDDTDVAGQCSEPPRVEGGGGGARPEADDASENDANVLVDLLALLRELKRRTEVTDITEDSRAAS